MRYMLAFVAVFAVVATAHAEERNWQDWEWKAAGKAEVIDGDTIRLRGVRLRLWGIDAPEIGQPCETTNGIPYDCGTAAKVRLEQLIDGREIRCFGFNDGRDKYGRQLAKCHVWGVYNLNAQMVREGWALTYLSDDYTYAEAGAKTRHTGMWRGRFVAPWEWRKRRPEL